ncbi:MAG: murein biosynthesis integral membrane protein MurJ [Omnitrophica WOR_2 bacterium]
MTTPVSTANRQIARAAGIVMLGFVLSNIIGLIRQNLISRVFGTGAEINAFTVAQSLPGILYSLIAGGALASAFIPTFASLLENDDRSGAWRLASSIINLAVLLLSLASLVTALLAPAIVRTIIAPDFSPPQQALTAALLQIMLISTVIFAASGLLMGILNTHQKFVLAALAPSMYWLGWILGVIFFVPSMGIFGLAWGMVLGAGLHLGIQLPGLFRLKGRYFPTLGLRFPAVREVGRLMAPRLLGVGIVQLNALVNTILAASMPEGSAIAIATAWMVVTMPEIAIAQAIAIAALPTFSAQVARGELSQMRSSLAATLRGVILLSLPASLGLILLRKPVVALLFQYGRFDAHSTDLVAWALLWYAAGLVGHSVVEILSRAFYSLHDTKTPVLVGSIAMSLNVIFSLSFSAIFSSLGWAPHGGLALANSLATFLEMGGLLYLMNRRLDGLEGRRILAGAVQAAVASLFMATCIWAWLLKTNNRPAWLVGLGGIGIGGVLFAVVVFILGVPEARALYHSLKRRLMPGHPDQL